MKELSPREALKQYRLQSPPLQNEQAAMFNGMPRERSDGDATWRCTASVACNTSMG